MPFNSAGARRYRREAARTTAYYNSCEQAMKRWWNDDNISFGLFWLLVGVGVGACNAIPILADRVGR